MARQTNATLAHLLQPLAVALVILRLGRDALGLAIGRGLAVSGKELLWIYPEQTDSQAGETDKLQHPEEEQMVQEVIGNYRAEKRRKKG